MIRKKKNKEIVTELYVYLSLSNKEWIRKQAKKKTNGNMSKFTDRLVTIARMSK